MITPEDFKKITHDTNGNPRYVIHFSQLLTDKQKELYPYNVAPIFRVNDNISRRYALALSRAHKFGGRKYHNKQYGGGVVFCTYSLA